MINCYVKSYVYQICEMQHMPKPISDRSTRAFCVKLLHVVYDTLLSFDGKKRCPAQYDIIIIFVLTTQLSIG